MLGFAVQGRERARLRSFWKGNRFIAPVSSAERPALVKPLSPIWRQTAVAPRARARGGRKGLSTLTNLNHGRPSRPRGAHSRPATRLPHPLHAPGANRPACVECGGLAQRKRAGDTPARTPGRDAVLVPQRPCRWLPATTEGAGTVPGRTGGEVQSARPAPGGLPLPGPATSQPT